MACRRLMRAGISTSSMPAVSRVFLRAAASPRHACTAYNLGSTARSSITPLGIGHSRSLRKLLMYSPGAKIRSASGTVLPPTSAWPS
ncbi:hypothetical protein D3C80_1598450 [compost metagenome]